MNIFEFFEDCVSKYGCNPLIIEKMDNEYVSVSYHDLYNRVKKFSIGLLTMGIKKGDKVAIYSDCGINCLVSELSLFCLGAIVVPLHHSNFSEDDLQFCLLHSDVRSVIVSKPFLEKILAIKEKLPMLDFLVSLGDYEGGEFDIVNIDRICKLGSEFYDIKNAELSQIVNSISIDDVAMIYYTRIEMKIEALLYTHKNLVSNIEQLSAVMQIGEWKRSYMLLPWSDIFVHQISIFLVLFSGSSVVVPRVSEDCFCYSFFRDLHRVRPNIVYLSLSSLKTIKNRIEDLIKRSGNFYYFLFERYVHFFALSLSSSKGQSDFHSIKTSFLYYYLIDKLICKKIRKALGEDVEYFILRGSYLDYHTELFFLSIGIPVLRGLGRAESCSLVSLNFKKVGFFKLGSVGKALPRVEIRVKDLNSGELHNSGYGELSIKSDSVIDSFHKNDQFGRSRIFGGWYFSGFLGRIDDEGFIFVEGDLKSLMYDNKGYKFSSQPIETAFYMRSSYIRQCYVVNKGMPHSVMLVIPERAALMSMLNSAVVDEKSVRDALRILYSSLCKIQIELQDEFSVQSLPKYYVVVGEELFVRRSGYYCNEIDPIIVEQCYAKEIQRAYAVEARDIYNAENIKNMTKILT